MSRRLSTARIVGIATWTAASITWGTTAIAVGSRPVDGEAQQPVVLSVPEVTTTHSPLPTIPDGGLYVLRYTPVAPPEPEVVIREVRVPGSSGASNATPTPPPATTTRSSGS